MLGDATPILFAATDRPEESRRFHGEPLGLELIADEPFALVFRAGPATLRIQRVERGVACRRFPGMEHNEQGTWRALDDTRVAWFDDPCGHLLSITEP